MATGFLNRQISSLHAAALILGGAAFLSKLLGLLRDRLLAARFGAGDTLDVYYAAFQIPDLLYTVFLLGAASAAVLPVFLAYERRGPQEAERFLSNLLTVFSAGALVSVLLVVALAPWLVPVVAPGFASAKLAATVGLTRLMATSALLLGIAGILSSVLQARHRFIVFALPPIFYNVGIIAGILFVVPRFGLSGLAWGVLAGGTLQILVQLPTLYAMRFRFYPRLHLREPGLREVLGTSGPRVLALAMGQLTLVALAAVASFFAAGSISVFKLAANLAYVPVSLFGVSYALAMFPKLSRASLGGRGEDFREQVAAGVRSILFWALPFSALFVVLRAHIVRVVLGSGAFDWEDTRLVAAIVAVLALAIISESILPLVLRAFYALGRTREPLVWDIAGSVATVLLALGFAAWFTARPGDLGALAALLRIGDLGETKILAVAAAFSLGSLANVFLLNRALRRAARERFGIALSVPWRSIAPLLGAAALGGLAAYAALLPFPALIATNTFLGIFIQGAAAGAAGLAVYGALLFLQRNPEIIGLVQSFQKHLLTPRRTPEVYEVEKVNGDAGK